MVLVDLLRQWARRKEATPAEIVFAGLLAQRLWIVPIPETTNTLCGAPHKVFEMFKVGVGQAEDIDILKATRAAIGRGRIQLGGNLTRASMPRLRWHSRAVYAKKPLEPGLRRSSGY